MSAARGDWFDAGMSLVSMLPYAGDAVGKTANGAKLMARVANLRKRIANNVVRGREIVANALKKDAAAIRAKRAAQKSEKVEDGIVSGCPVGGIVLAPRVQRRAGLTANAAMAHGIQQNPDSMTPRSRKSNRSPMANLSRSRTAIPISPNTPTKPKRPMALWSMARLKLSLAAPATAMPISNKPGQPWPRNWARQL
jgi:hypothetical protein